MKIAADEIFTAKDIAEQSPVVVRLARTDIAFALSRGAEFEDKYGLIQGVGKASKLVKIVNIKDVNTNSLRYYIKEALKFDNAKECSRETSRDCNFVILT
jgi:hypothetical protein